MSNFMINTLKEKEDIIKLWERLKNDFNVFILIHETAEKSMIYSEDNVETKTRVIRAFFNESDIILYINEIQEIEEDLTGTLKIGETTVQTLQRQMSKVYKKNIKEKFNVSCILTSYDKIGNIKDIDLLWSQFYH